MILGHLYFISFKALRRAGIYLSCCLWAGVGLKYLTPVFRKQ